MNNVPGPDGKFYRGKSVREGDKGGLYAAFRVLKARRQVVLDFGMAVTWLAMPPEAAMHQATFFREQMHEAFGKLSYDASTLPFVIKANEETGIIETHFLLPMEVLVANPEVFLAWADCLEEAVYGLWKMG